MASETTPWFVIDRSEALAGLLLARNDLLLVKERRKDDGVDFLVEIAKDGSPSMRLFLVQVKGTTNSDRAQWAESVGHLFQSPPGDHYVPSCIFVVDIKNNHTFYAWLAEPATEDEKAILKFNRRPAFQELDSSAVGEIINQVDQWYDVLPKQLMASAN